MKRSVLALAILFLLATTPVSAQQAAEILGKTAATYRSLTDYHIEGQIAIEMEVEGEKQNMEARLALAERGDDFRAEVESPNVQMLFISDGDSTWMYMPAANQYMARKGGFNMEVASETIPDITEEYKTVGDSIATATILRNETLETKQGKRPSYVISVAYKPRPTTVGADSTWKVLWIDQENFAVLKDETKAYLSESPAGSPMRIYELTTYTTVRIAGGLEDSLFAFTPPTDAERVNPESIVAEQSGLTGKPAMDFTLKSLDGKEVTLESQKGNVVLLNFWATWCGPCRSEMPVIEKLHNEFKDRGLVVLAIDIDERADEVGAFIKEHGFTFPILLDEGGAIASLYRADGIPMSLIIDREGKVLHHFTGARPEEEFRTALKDAGLQ